MAVHPDQTEFETYLVEQSGIRPVGLGNGE